MNPTGILIMGDVLVSSPSLTFLVNSTARCVGNGLRDKTIRSIYEFCSTDWLRVLFRDWSHFKQCSYAEVVWHGAVSGKKKLS